MLKDQTPQGMEHIWRMDEVINPARKLDYASNEAMCGEPSRCTENDEIVISSLW